MDIQRCIQLIENTAPLRAQASWDKSGVQIHGERESVSHLAVTLDPTPAILEHALADGADLILAHHPLAMSPQPLHSPTPYVAAARAVLSSGAWLYAAHTSLDANLDGPAAWLAHELGMTSLAPLETTWRSETRGALFSLDAPLETDDELAHWESTLARWRDAEGVMDAQLLTENGGGECLLIHEVSAWPALRAMVMAELDSHPAFNFVDLALEERVYGVGQCGALPAAMPFHELTDRLETLLEGRFAVLCTPPAMPTPTTISRLAICPGSGSSLEANAARMGADLLVTGDVKHHAALEASLPMLDVGHFSLEETMMRRFAESLTEAFAAEAAAPTVRFYPGADPLRLVTPRAR